MEERKLDRQQEVEVGYQTSVLVDKLDPYFVAMEAQLLNAVRLCSVTDLDCLHNIKLQLHALDTLKLNLESVINTGKLASAELEANDNGR